MLRSRDIELIAALVEGTLEDESEARALVARSEEARAEYEAQKLAYETLAAAAPAQLSDQERSALRRNLWTELQSAPTPAPRKAPWYYRWAPVAAGLLVMVGLVAVLSQNAGQSDQAAESFNEIAGGQATETTQAGADALEPADDSTSTMGDGEVATEDAAAPETPANTEFFGEVAEQVRSGDFEESTTLTRDATSDESTDPESCVEMAGLEGHDAIGLVSDSDLSGEPETSHYLVVVPTGSEIGPDTPVTFVDTDNCEIAYVDG